jgi:hypothetical protein
MTSSRSLGWTPRASCGGRGAWSISGSHEWYPDWHEIGCPGLHGQPCSRYCSVEVRRRRQEMSGSGRFYRRVHLGIWLAGVRWWHFWLHLGLRSYTVFDAIERFLAPDLFADES